MDNKTLFLGITGEASIMSDKSTSANSMESGNVEVFSTPWMIALMEEAARTSVKPYLSPEQTTVGTHIDISHDSATPTGMKVTAKSELTEIDGRRLVFKVSAFDEAGPIGKGTHERFIINAEKFMEKTKAKLSK